MVGALVCHIGSGLASETDPSCTVCKELGENHPLEMAPFANFLKVTFSPLNLHFSHLLACLLYILFLNPLFSIYSQGILDYLDNLTISQIRKLFSLLSMLAFYNSDGSMIQVSTSNIV